MVSCDKLNDAYYQRCNMIDCDCIREILLGWYLALQLMLMLVTKETLAAVRMHVCVLELLWNSTVLECQV